MRTLHTLQDCFTVTEKLCCHLPLYQWHHRKGNIGHNNHQKAKDQTALIRAQKCHQIFQTVTNLMNTFSFIFSLINGHSAVPPHSAGMLQFHNITDILLIIPYDVPWPPAGLHPAQESDPHP